MLKKNKKKLKNKSIFADIVTVIKFEVDNTMYTYTEENFNDFAVLGKKSFSLGKILESSILKDDEKDIYKQEQVISEDRRL